MRLATLSGAMVAKGCRSLLAVRSARGGAGWPDPSWQRRKSSQVDPIGDLMVQKVREYKSKKGKLAGGEQLVEATEATARGMQMELDQVARSFRLAPGEDLTQFPQLSFQEPALEMPELSLPWQQSPASTGPPPPPPPEDSPPPDDQGGSGGQPATGDDPGPRPPSKDSPPPDDQGGSGGQPTTKDKKALLAPAEGDTKGEKEAAPKSTSAEKDLGAEAVDDSNSKQPADHKAEEPDGPPSMAPSLKEMREEWKKDPKDLPEGVDEEDPVTDTDPHRQTAEEQAEGLNQDKVKKKEDEFVP